MSTATLPTTPAVPVTTALVGADADMARVVPDWARRLAKADGGSPWIRMPAFITGRYLPVGRDVHHYRAARYNRRVWQELVKARSRGGLVDMGVYDPRPGELACELHDPDVKGAPIQISKRLFMRQVLGCVPIIRGFQP